MRPRTTMAACAAAATLLTGGVAQAHVTLQPPEAPAGGFTRLDVRVPNERDDEGTTKVEVQMPPGFVFVSTEPVPGWTAKTTTRKLDKPVTDHGEQITEEVGTVTFTGKGSQGVIKPGEFQDFGLSVGIPEGKVGSKLTFKALQTYQGGEVVRWIGAPDSDSPAPQVTLTAAEGEHGAGGHDDGASEEGGAANASTSEPAAAAPVAAADDDDSKGLAIAALVVGALGLLAGGFALVTSRKTA